MPFTLLVAQIQTAKANGLPYEILLLMAIGTWKELTFIVPDSVKLVFEPLNPELVF